MTVEELLLRITSYELSEWQIYERMTGPLGGAKLEYLFAMLAATVSNGFKGLAGKRGARRLDQFMLKWDRTKRKLSPQELLQEIRGINKALGGTEKGPEKGS
jgi:hypothetical protein